MNREQKGKKHLISSFFSKLLGSEVSKGKSYTDSIMELNKSIGFSHREPMKVVVTTESNKFARNKESYRNLGSKSVENMVKIEEQANDKKEQLSPLTPTFPNEKSPLAGNFEMQNHLKNLESLFKLQQTQIIPNQKPMFKTPSLSNIPSGSDIQSPMSPTFCGLQSMLSNQTPNPIIPNVGLNQLSHSSTPLLQRSFSQNQGAQDPLQSGEQSSHLQGMQQIQNQINRINLLNNLISQQQQQQGQRLPLSNANSNIERTPRSIDYMDLEGANSLGSPHLSSQLFNENRSSPFYSSQFSQDDVRMSMAPHLLRPRIYSTEGQDRVRNIFPTQDTRFAKSATLTDLSSPKSISIGASPLSLWEIIESKKNENNPSITSLDEDISLSTKFQTKTTHPAISLSLNSQFEGLNLNKEDAGNLLSKNSYRSMNRDQFDLGLFPKAYSLPDINMMPDLKPRFTEKIEEEDSMQPFRYGFKSVPGVYSKEERAERILRYKKKIVKWRVAHPVSRAFSGRSFVAGSKPRIKGKFVSSEEYKMYLQKDGSKKGSELGLSEANSEHHSEIKIEEESSSQKQLL